MKKIVIKTDQAEVDQKLLLQIMTLFPACEIQICSAQSGSLESPSRDMVSLVSENKCKETNYL